MHLKVRSTRFIIENLQKIASTFSMKNFSNFRVISSRFLIKSVVYHELTRKKVAVFLNITFYSYNLKLYLFHNYKDYKEIPKSKS